MSMYRTIDTVLWTDPVIRQLEPEGKLLFLYLVTNPHTHASGIYYLPRLLMSLETGIDGYRIDTLSDTLSRLGLAHFDPKNEVVWVVKMLRYQGRGEKMERAAAHNLKNLHKSFLIQEFLAFYPEVKRYVPDTPSIPHRYPIEGGSRARYEEQEQEQYQEQEKNICSEPLPAASEPTHEPSIKSEEFTRIPEPTPFPSEPPEEANGEPPDEPALLEFPVVGTGAKVWPLSAAKVAEYAEAFPGMDVLAECRKARQWCIDNPAKRKTARGMPAFLNNWLSTAQNRGWGARSRDAPRREPGKLAAEVDARIEALKNGGRS